VAVFAYQFDVSVRPYTLRKGDTVSTIAQKRGGPSVVMLNSLHWWVHAVPPDADDPPRHPLLQALQYSRSSA